MEEQIYLKPKREFQGLQGSLLNPNYYNARETVLSNAETTYVQSRWVQSFSSAQFGSTAQFILSSDDLISGTYLHLALQENLVPDAQNLSPKAVPGWGLAAIRSISYMIPGSNVGRINLSNTAIYHLLTGMNQDYATTTLMLMLAGQKINGPGDAGFTHGQPVNDSNRYADVLLPLPWSSMDPEVKPLDAYMFKSGSVIVTVELNPSAMFLNSAGTKAGSTNTSFSTVELSFRQGCYTNKASSLRDKLLANPSLSYSYPFIKVDTRDVAFKTQSPQVRNTIDITGFLPADLVGMVLTLHQRSRLSGATLEPFTLINPVDVELTFASQIMYRAAGTSYRLYGFQSVHSSGYDSASAEIDNDALVLPRPNFPIYIDLAMKRQCAFGDIFYNTKRFEGQSMQLSFKAGFDEKGVTLPADIEYVAKLTILYNSVIEVSAGAAQVYGV